MWTLRMLVPNIKIDKLKYNVILQIFNYCTLHSVIKKNCTSKRIYLHNLFNILLLFNKNY